VITKSKAPNKAGTQLVGAHLHCTKRSAVQVLRARFQALCVAGVNSDKMALPCPTHQPRSAGSSTGNASRSDCRIRNFPKIIFEKWERNAEKCLVFGVPHNILATSWQFLSLLWEIFMDIFRTRGFSTVSLGGC
jgi:hypothetical protein